MFTSNCIATMLMFLPIAQSATEQPNSEVIVVESKDVTSKDIPLKFELQKTTWDGGQGMIRIWGKVSNDSKTPYEFVQLSFTAYDKDGKFIGRKQWVCNPANVGTRQVGYIDDDFIETEGRKPFKIEFKVLGTAK
jgi:hypothetical protein